MDAAIMDQAVRAAADREGKYLTFDLAGEQYGIGILKVKEIIGLTAITTVPRTPDYVKGVINLRGKVIPIVDLRLKFGMERVPHTDRTCIIVVEIRGAGKTILMGIVVDSVSEVLNVRDADIEDTPCFGTQLGMAKISGSVKILLDIDQIFRSDELDALSQPS
jgi:purine-binding chemotaxis protein CheW